MNRYPLKKQADELAKHGRYGDSVLVHMNPVELEGIAALTPHGLSTNPVTGQPEAFAFLIPLAASGIGAAAGWGALGTAALSGAMTAAYTGDVERGLASAVMGAGVGSALGAMGEAGAEAALSEAASQAATDAAAQGITDATIDAGAQAAVDMTGQATAEAAREAAIQQMLQDQTVQQAGIGVTGTDIGLTAADTSATMMSNPAATMTPDQYFQDATMGERAGMMFGEAGRGEAINAFTQPSAMMPIALGGSELERMTAEAEWETPGSEKDEQKARDYYNDLQMAYRRAQPGAMTGISPYRMNSYLPGPYRPPGMNTGGPVDYPGAMGPRDVTGPSMPDGGGGGNAGRHAAAGTGSGILPTDARAGMYYGMGGGNPGYGGIDPVTIQANLRGDAVPVPQGFVAGFAPEMRYFQNVAEGEMPEYPEYSNPAMSSNHLYNPGINRFMYQPMQPQQQYFPSYLPPGMGITPPGGGQPMDPMGGSSQASISGPMNPYAQPAPGIFNPKLFNQFSPYGPGMNQGGQVPVNTGSNTVMVAEGGIADMASAMPGEGQPPQAPPPEPQEIEIVSAAILGQVPEDQQMPIIEEFIQRHGQATFLAIREQVLQNAAGGGAQTQGKIEGQGSGMDDQVPGVIGNQSPVAVSPGEYIVPADVVSGLGDGSSDAGTARLDEMMNKVRAERQDGDTSQPPPVDPNEVMP